MITSSGIIKITDLVKGMIASATCTIGSTTKTVTIESITQNVNTITIKLYLDDSISGTITRFQVKAADGTTIIDRPDNIQKSDLKGLYVIFNINIQEV